MVAKIIGSLLVITACGAGGVLMGTQMRRRYDTLSEGRRAVELLQAQIRTEGSSLPEALRETGERCKGIYGACFQELSSEMLLFRGEPVCSLWNEVAKKHLTESCLREEDATQFVLLGEQLGMTDRKMQETILGRYLEYTDHELSELLVEMKDKTRLYRNLGFLFGTFVTILLL